MAEAERSRARILDATVVRASRFGLESVTIGAVAADVGMSKAGVVGPFGSREALLERALGQAVEVFRRAVITPLEEVPAGPQRLARLVELWVAYLEDCPFPGGCLVTAASSELDHRPGPLRDALREVVLRWRCFLEEEVGRAEPIDDARTTVTLLVGVAMAADQEIQLLEDPTAAARARHAMRTVLGIGNRSNPPVDDRPHHPCAT